MKYKVLAVDHDDTAVDSTRLIHHPIYLDIMKEMRPDVVPVDVDGFIDANQRGHIKDFYREEYGFSHEEWLHAFDIWVNHPLRETVPKFYEGFVDILREHEQQGGIVAVVSHSNEAAIRDHYTTVGFMPDRIFGVDEHDKTKNKPHSWPLKQLISEEITPTDIAVIDDLMPGIRMAKSFGSYALGVGWSHSNTDTFKEQCDFYFDTVKELREHLYD